MKFPFFHLMPNTHLELLLLVESFLQRSEGFMVNWGTLAVNPG